MRVVLVSTHRSDRGHYAPLRRVLEADARFEVIVPGMDGWRPGGLDAAVVLGDRKEMLEQAIRYVDDRVPLLHIHGGEHTYGSLDERWRYAISAIADVHCVATSAAGDQLMSLGYTKVHVTGAPGLDGITERKPFPNPPKIVVLYNPAIDAETTKREVRAIAEATIGTDHLWIDPNGDSFSELIPRGYPTIGHEAFRDLLTAAHVIVGNSSAGIIEAPSLGTWTVNVGERQAGRARANSVFDVPGDAGKIRAMIDNALSVPMGPVANPYGDGRSSERIRDVLLTMALG